MLLYLQTCHSDLTEVLRRISHLPSNSYLTHHVIKKVNMLTAYRSSCWQVDVSNIYGGDKETENRLRLFSGGKLKMQVSVI